MNVSKRPHALMPYPVIFTVMEVQPQCHVRPPRTRANRPEVITSRGRIIGYHEAGKGIREISRLLGISRDTVRLWVRRYEEEGHVVTRPPPGRPRVTTPAADEHIQRAVERAPLSTAVRITRETGVQCHPITTRRRIRETGRQCFIPARKETLTEAHREARKRFAEAYAGVDFWRSVIFTDENLFSSVAAVGRQCWRLRNTRYARRHIHETSTSGRVTTSMHAWMWWGGVGELTDIEGHMNADQYINILETSFLPSLRAYAIPDPQPICMVQDHSPMLTSWAVKRWFEVHPQIILLDWPPKGADCNPIENLWAHLVVEWDVEEKTREAVRRHGHNVWEGIRRRPNICSNLVDSMPTRLHEVIAADGGWTRYQPMGTRCLSGSSLASGSCGQE